MLGRAPANRVSSITITVALGAATAACTPPPVERHPLGEIPSAVTTAEPEWLPPRVRSGKAEEADAREPHLTELRRLTEGYDIDELAFALDAKLLVLVGRAPGSKLTALFGVDLAKGTVEPLDTPNERALGLSVNGRGDEALVVLAPAAAGAPPRIEDVSAAAIFAKAFGKAAPPAFTAGPLTISRAALAPDGSSAYFVARSNDGPGLGLFASSRGAGPAGRALVSGLAEVTPAVSPDRAYVAFVRDASGGQQSLVMASIEGRSPRELAAGARFASVAFHPSGERVVYGSDRDREAFELYSTPLGTEPKTSPERLTFRGAKSVAFTPDGRQIAFTSKRAGGTFDVFVGRWREAP
ncbi:MAG TPA: hypothetical protein VL400_12350 [Polyangiaceae bacterium]|nr:hypothetical protein [Polyangiaceae bacterium]